MIWKKEELPSRRQDKTKQAVANSHVLFHIFCFSGKAILALQKVHDFGQPRSFPYFVGSFTTEIPKPLLC